MVEQQEHLAGYGIAAPDDHAQMAKVVMSTHEGGNPDVGAKGRHAA